MLSSRSLLGGHGLRSTLIPTLEGVANNGNRRWLSSLASVPVDDDDDVPSFSERLQQAADAKRNDLENHLRPSQIVTELDKHIIGQQDAKRAVAIALRNRWRRKQLPEDFQKEIMPRNVLLVGPTGCGKTEVARRMAKLNDAPFLKVEATKFTEVGYHGRDVDKIISDLMETSLQLTQKRETEKFKKQAQSVIEDRILDLLTGPMTVQKGVTLRTGETFREMLRQGMLEDQEVEVEIPQNNKQGLPPVGGDAANNPNIVAVLRTGGPVMGNKPRVEKKRVPISEARKIIMDTELAKMMDNVDLVKEAIKAVEESGIVFIDEIDKICSSSSSEGKSTDASAEGVQRDFLPLVEGTTISTKHGNVNTDYILFVASGAFHAVKPSDMLPELQGRFPVRVELKGLSEDDLYRILTEPVANMVRQQIELLRTEGVELVFSDEAIREIARMAYYLNRSVENIGARRLHTVMERIMEQMSFEAAELERGSKLIVSKEIVEERLKGVTTEQDLSRFIL